MKTAIRGEEELSSLLAELKADVPPGEAEIIRPAGTVELLGGRLLARSEALFVRATAAFARLVPPDRNPLSHPGAVANMCFIVAVVSGVLLLFWYSASVHSAYESVAGMSRSRFGAGLVRSVHRYSSDACMFLVLYHAVATFVSRKVTGARWLAWITGLCLLGSLFLVGWLGYWLVWDERARQVALGTARMADVLPIFADPLSRSFLTETSVNTLLFFVIFFAHMLLPLAMGVALWLHIVRVARSRFLTDRVTTLWILGSLIALSLALPADAAAPARMTVNPDAFTMDWWYLAPLALTDRLGGGALWSVCLIGAAALGSLPWTMSRRRALPAITITSRCNACESCFNDCPYNAIEMVPRTDGKRFETQSRVLASRCVGCGVCAGSCCSAGIGLAQLETEDVRARLERWVAADTGAGGTAHVAFLCGGAAGCGLEVDPSTGRCDQLEGYRVLAVPCSGWVTPTLVDAVLRAGAAGVLISSCGAGTCLSREGDRWTEARMSGAREPELRERWRTEGRVLVAPLYRHERARLIETASAFRDGRPARPPRRRVPAVVGAILVVSILGAVTYLGSDLGYHTGDSGRPHLVVSFKHPGQTSGIAHQLTPEELEKLPVHMRPQAPVVDRTRVPVRLEIVVDGELVLRRAYPPRGLWGDGNSIAIERLELEPGRHRVRIAIGDSPDESEYAWQEERELEFEPSASRVVLFDKVEGLQWH